MAGNSKYSFCFYNLHPLNNTNPMTYLEKLKAIRQQMSELEIDAYIIPSSDPHISEYLPERYKCIAWTSGFTGSAGTLVITQNFAGLWTDGRYFVQANEQLAGMGFQLVKLKAQGVAEYVDWIADHFRDGGVIGFDGKLASVGIADALISQLNPLGIVIKGDVDLLDAIWESRPTLPAEPAYLVGADITGQSTPEKIAVLRAELARQHVDAHLISSLDDLAWLLNIRGSDVACNPVVLGFVLVTSQKVGLFIDVGKLSAADQASLKADGVSLFSYDALGEELLKLEAGTKILMDPRRTCFAWYDSIPEGVAVIEATNPTTNLKAIKNDVEITNTRETMVKDGVALTRFFKWLEESLGKERITEISLAEKLRGFRAEQEGFVGESFDTIAGYKEHGALPHYKATPESDALLEADGLLLVDSGGQYYGGTTDITRVISMGNITDEQRTDYTLVLKGMIEGITTIYTYGTKGYQIDGITRRPLWTHLRNYGHGTGHGVGFFLNVHEGPQVFNAANVNVAIEAGMITSIEPGLYREGEYGIRIENLVLSRIVTENQFGIFMDFESLALCYIDTDLVDKSLLDQPHIDWLNGYHQTVYDKLSPFLRADERAWLGRKTEAI